jgi:endonuclease/exonuclease/phosphatase family metal-dependent hydrolase
LILRILTLNAGLLRLLGRIEAAPQVEARAEALGSELRRMDADIVLLQEVYNRRHNRKLTAELNDIYPWVAYDQRRRFFGLDNSLMTFSRHRMSSSIELFTSAPFLERIVDRKGILISRVDLGSSALTVLNTHTTAGGPWFHPERAFVERIRGRQINQVLRVAGAEKGIVVIAGDFNAGPSVSRPNFQSILRAGFVSVHDWLHPSASEFTWEPSNRLNVGGPHRMCPAQRIDHMFVQRATIEPGRLRPLHSYVCFQEESVKGTDGLMYTVSDHLGLCAEFDLAE